MAKKEEQAVKKCVLPYHVLIVVVLVLSVFVGIVSAGNVNDETKNSLSSTMTKPQLEEPSSILTITILNETTASGKWLIHAPGEFSSYIPYETKRLEENIDSLEKGVEDLLLQEVKNIKIIEGNETIILTFDLLGNYTNSFVTEKFRYTYELNEYAPCFLNVLKIVIPQNKTLISVNPGVNAREGNALIYYDYNWIYPLDIRFTEKTYSISVIMGEEWELPKPYLVDSSELSEEKRLNLELSEEGKSRFAEPNLWVGTGEDIVPGTSKGHSAKLIAEYYRPRLYRGLLIKCPDEVYYRVIKGYDLYTGFTDKVYLIQYFAYWNVQIFPPHKNDFEPIFIWVRNIGDKPYRVAYDRMGEIHDNHVHEVHRTYPCLYPSDGHYFFPAGTHTNDKAYYPYGNSPYGSHHFWNDLYLLDISTSLKDNWAGNQVKLGIAGSWHTFDTDISGKECPHCELEPLTDAELEKAYLLKRDIVEPFKYDISDPFDGVFWEDNYHRAHEFPTISGDITSAVVNNEILTVKVSMFYDNTGAGGSPDQHLRGLWEDRFGAKISTDTGYVDIGDPYYFDEQSPGEYILKYDVSGIDINSVLILSVWDNVGDLCLLSKDITFVSVVEKGLHWLRTQQNPDGSWQNSVGITSMTALAFLNADYTEDDPTVNKAIQYILDNKNADRSFGRETYDTASEYNLANRSADRSFGGTYETSTAVWALVATHNPDYNDEIADAKAWLINAQYDEGEGIDSTNPYYGGWSYGLEPSWADLSNTQFALMALDAANLPKSSDVWAKAITYISRCQNRPASNDQAWAHDDTKPSYNDGGFIYCPEWGFAPEFGETGSYGSITAAGIWSLRLCGVDVSDRRVQAGLNWLANNEDCSFDDNPGHPYGQEHCFLYYYYMSLAKALVMCFEDDLICDDWYNALSIKLINLQHDDGYWINTEASHGQENIPEIATDFAILALQTKQPPAADLWMSVIIASNATLTVYDPQGRYARLGDITIPGATFEIDGDGRQIVNLTELQAGKYRVELKGTADGDYSLTIEGYRDEEKTSSETFESTIKEGEYQKSDVLVTSMVGALTIIAEEPEDLLVTDLPNVELVSADPTVTSINVTGLSLSEINITYKPAEIAPQSAYMVNSTGAGSFTLRFTDILDASAIIVYKINTTNQWIEILDTATTANTVTFTMEVGDPPVVFGLSEPPSVEQPQYFKEKSSVQGIGSVAIDKKIQDWNAAIDVEEYMEGFGEFAMESCEILNESAMRSDPSDPNYYNQKMINFQGNNTNRLTSFTKYESPTFYGGTGAKVREFFDVSMIQKQEFGSIKTDSALGTAQSLDFATMDDFSGIWSIHSDWQKICQKKIAHHQLFAGNFSVQKDLTFEREVVMP